MTPTPTPKLSFAELTVKQLVDVLKHLKGGSIGFDPFRDERTKGKSGLQSYILNNYGNDAIASATRAVASTDTASTDAANAAHDAYVAASHASQAQQATTDQTTLPADKAQAIADILGIKGGMSRAEVIDIVSAAVAAVDKRITAIQAPVRVVVENKTLQTTYDAGIQHRNFPDLLLACQARGDDGNRLNIWLYGPAATGKTHAAHEIAKALGLPFRSNGTLLTEHALSGYKDANGNYHRTAFREIFEYGGIYLGDEFDGWNPKAKMYLQAATANGYTEFPDGLVKRHADCVLIFGANTLGKGATSDYSTREKTDEATITRVVYQEWPLDEALETAVCSNKEWCRRVQQVRARVATRKLKGHLITPRQSFQGAALLAGGMSWEKVETMVLRRGLSDEQWDEVK